jgi:hypothetical protein
VSNFFGLFHAPCRPHASSRLQRTLVLLLLLLLLLLSTPHS